MSLMDRPLYLVGPRWRRQPKGPESWGEWLHRPLHQSIASVLEEPFIEKILDDLHYRSNVFNLKGLDAERALITSRVELREFRNDRVGDIDILIVPRGRPKQSTAIQVKRFPIEVKFHEDDDPDAPDVREQLRWQRIRRMERLWRKGVRQANYAAQVVGFSQVYLWAFVLADTRAANGGRYTYDGPDSSLRSEISHALSTASLDPRVGVVHYEWVQPMDRPPLELATYGGSLQRLAARTEQPNELTEWLRTLSPSSRDLAIVVKG